MRVPKQNVVAAKAWVEAWVEAHTSVWPPALWLVLAVERNNRRGARYIGVLHAPNGECLNRDLLASGLALPYSDKDAPRGS